jgi:Fe(3+) dicitrate transport protein
MNKYILVTFIFNLSVSAQQSTQIDIKDLRVTPEEKIDNNDDTIYVIGSQKKAFYMPGSAHFIEKKELEKFDYTDVGRVLDKIPGVYVQDEDGLGLRPNIGLRGAHPHRSRKITMMEDGLLIGPAPYSAPAAYYFPTTARISGMEVFKGPSSVKYGPNSIGGAINMVTKPIGNYTEVDLSGGFINQVDVTTTGRTGKLGYLIQANRKEGNLVRQVQDADNLTFEQNDIMLKLDYDFTGDRKNVVSTKLSFANESSDETYLGLSKQDFDENSRERYAASADDNMQWERFSGTLSYALKATKQYSLKITGYHNTMTRLWSKFNQLITLDSAALRQVLANDQDRGTVALLKGERDSEGASDQLIIGGNDRRYYSQGVQLGQKIALSIGATEHDISLGFRVHRDQVTRDHTEVNALMIGGKLNYLEDTSRDTNRTQDTSLALALFLQDEMTIGNLTTLIGSRVEQVKATRNFRDETSGLERQDTLVVPGIGFNYSLSNNAVLLAGVNRGVTLVGPGQAVGIEPESSINYEAGFRIKAPLVIEAIGFYSDYGNIKGACSFSAGCTDNDLDREFNGGAAEVFGLESTMAYELFSGAYTFPVSLNYTYTMARFKENFESDNGDWGVGTIVDGDPLPYIPHHQLALKVGVNVGKYSSYLNYSWKGRVSDQAVSRGRSLISSYSVIDLSTNYQYSKKARIYARLDNIFATEYAVSLRPFGLRPGKPRSVTAGLKYVF